MVMAGLITWVSSKASSIPIISLLWPSPSRSGSSSFLKAQKAFEVTDEASFSCPRMSSLIWRPESFPKAGIQREIIKHVTCGRRWAEGNLVETCERLLRSMASWHSRHVLKENQRPPRTSGASIEWGSVAWKYPILIQWPFDRLVMWAVTWPLTCDCSYSLHRGRPSNKNHSWYFCPHYCFSGRPSWTQQRYRRSIKVIKFIYEPISWLFAQSRSVSMEMLGCAQDTTPWVSSLYINLPHSEPASFSASTFC